MVKEWDVNKGGLRNTGITFCPATVLRAEGQIEFDRSLDLKIRRVHFLFSCEFRGPSGDFFIVGRVDKRNRHATTPWYLGFFDGQPPSRDFSRVNMCEFCACSSTRLKWNTVTPRPSLRSASMSGHSVPESRSGSISTPPLSVIQRLFTDSRAFLPSSHRCSWTVFIYAKSVTDFACNDMWTIISPLMNTRLCDAGLNDASIAYFCTRDWRIYVKKYSEIFHFECSGRTVCYTVRIKMKLSHRII